MTISAKTFTALALPPPLVSQPSRLRNPRRCTLINITTTDMLA